MNTLLNFKYFSKFFSEQIVTVTCVKCTEYIVITICPNFAGYDQFMC